MFTVKATYRGETRKLSFPYTTSFPTYDELCSQLYRVFPINNSYYLARLLYSPNADTPARILLASEVHTEEHYTDAVKPHSGRVYPNALLRFSVFDDTPHKTPNHRYSLNINSMSANGASRNASLYSVQDRPSSLIESDKRPTVPPKPAELFAHPFEYISALSGRSPSVRSTSLRTVPMDIDNTPSSSSQPQSQAQTSTNEAETSISGHTSTSSCCSAAEVKEDIKALISDFEKEVNRTLEKGFGSAVAAPQVSISVSESPTTPSAPVDLGALFSEGSFPSNGPARRHTMHGDAMRGRRRGRGNRGSHPGLQPTGCLNASVSQEARPLPQTPEQVVHTHVICDNCNKTVVGVRNKCLDCPDYDLCTPCIKEQNAAENHNPFHEFFEIREPGRVIVHTVFEGDRRRGEFNSNAAAAPPMPAHEPSMPVAHNARCDLCDTAIIGTRYKCCECPDFDTCASCFQITPEQHPKHSFVKLETLDGLIRRFHGRQRRSHFARCDSCQQTIHGVRYKCMHPECPDFDLCDRCEAMPIPVHPETHPMLKMRTPDVVVPTVYRVGGTEIIPQTPFGQPQISTPWAPAASSSTGQTRHYAAGYRPSYAPRDGYQPAYIKSQTCMSMPTPGVIVFDEATATQPEEDRASTPRPIERTLSLDFEDQNPFADPPPVIAPIEATAERSLASSFNASLEDRMNSVRDASPLSEASQKEASLFEGFLDRPKAQPEQVQVEQERKDSAPQTPSFVSDVLEDFFKAVSKRKEMERKQEETQEPEMSERKLESDEALSTLVSGVSRLVAIVKGETPIAESPVAEEVPEEAPKSKEPEESEKKDDDAAEEQVLSTLVRKVTVSEPEKVAEEPKVEIEVVVQEEEEVEKKEEKKDDVPAPPSLSAGFVTDVTVPDGQVFPPGAEFMKCWGMVNDGPIDWPETTEVVFVAGEPGLVKQGNEVVRVGAVKAGERVDVWTGELKAPETVGRYVGYWRLRDSATKEVFGNSIWAEIEVAEADHLSDESSLSGSSIVRMPTGLGTDAMSEATSVRPQSLTLTIPSSGSTTTGGESDIGSDVSLIDDDMSDGDLAAWEDARSRVAATSVAGSAAPSAAPVAPGSPLGDEFELVYDSGSDM